MSDDESTPVENPEEEQISEGLSEIIDEGEFEEGELEIQIIPREEKLAELGVTLEEFENAFGQALAEDEELFNKTNDVESIRPLEELPITLAGQTFRLDELAEIETPEGEGDLFK